MVQSIQITEACVRPHSTSAQGTKSHRYTKCVNKSGDRDDGKAEMLPSGDLEAHTVTHPGEGKP